MNQKVYKYFGIFLITLTFIIVAFALVAQIMNTGALTRGYGNLDYFVDLAIGGILFSLIVLVLGLFPGLFYYRFGNETNKPSKLVKFAFILKIISAIIIILVSILIFFSCINGCDGLGEGILFVTFGVPALIIYSLGVLLLITFKFKTKNFKLRTTEKIILVILLIMALFVATIYGMALYEENSRSIERCDSKQNQKDKDECHYMFSQERPDLAQCEKIRSEDSTWWKEQCYLRKAQHYKDTTFCDQIISSETWKANCIDVAS